MNVFVFAAVVMAVILLVWGAQRPRAAIFVAAVLWLLYAYYERQVATGVLCEADCNIRVDLVFFFPILGLATYCAYQSYMGRPGQLKVIGTVLGVIGLLVLGLVAESRGYGNLVGAAVVLGALAFGVYAFKSRSKTNRT
jgi:peptidoglycan/LPS O-acetylase OafA/YrhL